MLTTFDVFDTLLTRRVAEPEAVFLMLGARLASAGEIPVSAEVFARQRGRIEEVAMRRSPTGHAGLADIYRELARQFDQPAGWAIRTAEAELELEREVIVAVPGAAERVALARTRGRVMYLSDMYLPSGFIRSLLERHAIITDDETLLVSAEEGMSKRDGTVFAHVLQTAADGDGILHIGDNEESDIARPGALGISTAPFTEARPNRYEDRLETHRWSSQGLTSALAGASRYARLASPHVADRDHAIRTVAAGVAAPLLVGYVAWVLHRARALGLRRLYFVARDGEVLLDIARVLDRGSPQPLELRYLYGSRQSWYPAGVDPDRPLEALRELEAHDDSVRSLLDRCGVDAAAWVPPSQLSVSGKGLHVQIERLSSDPRFLAAVTRGLHGRQDRLLRYARQEGLLEDAAHGIVDVGWYGRSLAHFSALLEKHGGARPLGFYLGFLAKADPRLMAEVWLEGYEHRVRSLIVPIEAFMAGTHGGVIDFEVQPDGSVRPTLQSERNDPVVEWGLGSFRDAVYRFAEFFAETTVSWPDVADSRTAALDGLELFWYEPSAAEARAWAAFPWERVTLAAAPKTLAARRRFDAHLLEALRRGRSTQIWAAGDRELAPRSWKAVRHTGKAVARSLRRFRGR